MKQVHQEGRVQAEIAGGSIVPTHEIPRKGQYLRGFELKSLNGSTVRLGDYRGQSAVVLILADERPETNGLLREAGRRYEEIRRKDAQVLAIVHYPRPEAAALRHGPGLPFPVLLDEDDRLHRELGAIDEQNRDAAAVCITDRFGEVFALYRTAEGMVLPGVGEILRHLEFISFQCPECEPPEWPV